MIFWSMWPNTNVKLIFRGAQSCKLACASVALFSLSFTFAGWADPICYFQGLHLLLQKRTHALSASAVSIAVLTSDRTNLSPFTKGCRDRGAPMRLTQFLDVKRFRPFAQPACRCVFLLLRFVIGVAFASQAIILAEGAIVRSMTLCGGVLVAS